MAITLVLRPEAEAELSSQANASGLAIDAYVERLVANARNRCAPEGAAGKTRGKLMDIAKQWHALPTLDARPADELVEYDEHGLPAR